MSIESTFPTEMASDVRLMLPDTGLGERADAAIRSLHEHGMVAAAGLTEYHAGSLAMIAAEPHIVEYCRNDSVSRHGSLAMARKWHAKDGGRGFVGVYDVPGLGNRPLNNDEVSDLRSEDLRILAEGWSGYLKGKVNPFIADAPVTTAYRVSQLGLALARERRDGSRFGLGGPLGELVIAETVVTYGIPAKQISLDCWRMNQKAAGLYVRLGFEHRAEEPDVWRPTLLPADGVNVIARTVGGATINYIRDTRDHYQLHDHPLMRAT